MIGIPQINTPIEIMPIDTSSEVPRYLVKTPEEKQFEISEFLKNLIQLIDGNKSIEVIADEISHHEGKNYNPGDIKKVIDQYFVPNRIVVGENTLQVREKKGSYLYVKKSLFSQSTLRPITNVLHIMFYPKIILGSISTIVLFLLYFYLVLRKPGLDITSLSGNAFLQIYIWFFVSIFFHELGHSSACNHFKVKHGDIGIGMYLFFPVFYTNVSDIWRLKRLERVVVDLGGIYFQCLLMPIFYLVYSISDNVVFLYLIYVNTFSVITSLNPLLRFDGYWIVSDLSGIPNLRKRSKIIFQSVVNKIFHRPSNTTLLTTNVPQKIKYFLYSYAILSNLFFAFFIYEVLLDARELLYTYPSNLLYCIQSIISDINNNKFVDMLDHFSKIFMSSLMIVMFIIIIYRAIRFISSKIDFKR